MKREKRLTWFTTLTSLLLIGMLLFSGCSALDGVLDSTSEQNYTIAPETSETSIKLPTAQFTRVGYMDCVSWEKVFLQKATDQLSQWLPTLTVGDADQLQSFIGKAKEHLYLDYKHGDSDVIPLDVLSKFDDTFFDDHVLLVSYFIKTTGDHLHEISELSIENGKLSVGIRTLRAGIDMEMDGWLLTVELPRSILEGVTSCRAYIDNYENPPTSACAKISMGSNVYWISGTDAQSLTDLLTGLKFVKPDTEAENQFSATAIIEISSGSDRYEFHDYPASISCKEGIAELTSEQRLQFNEILSRTQKFRPEIKGVAHYPWVNWDEDGKAVFNDLAALRVEGTQCVVKISSKEDLNSFIEITDSYFSLDGRGMNSDKSFMKLAENYDDQFFTTHSLLITYVTEGSGSISHQVTDFIANDQSLTMIIKRYSPMIQTCDMAGWFVTVEVHNNWIEHYTSFGAIVE